MPAAPQLTALAREAARGLDGEAALVRVLLLLCEQLGMEHASLGRTLGEVHVFDLVVQAGVGRVRDVEGGHPVGQVLCPQVPPRGALLLPEAPELPGPLGPLVRCYAGTTVRDPNGRALGVLGVAGPTAHAGLTPRDEAVLAGLAGVVGELWTGHPVVAVPQPRRPRTPDLGAVADVVAAATDLEGLTRPLLEALHEVSGIASTYLAVVHEEDGVQEIRYSRNGKDGFGLPEGLRVPWEDTLCKRALDEGRSCTTDVPDVWGDSDAAQDLGIVTYVSVPVRLSDGRVWGTLCGADDVVHPDAAEHLSTLGLFATLIAAEVERSAVLARELARAERAQRAADTDVLTGCGTRRTVLPWLQEALATCPDDAVVALVYVDVDAFKPVNDTHGHATGDAVLTVLGERLRAVGRPGDLVARLGGDELVVAAVLPPGAPGRLRARVADAGRFGLPVGDTRLEVRCATGLATAGRGGDAEALLAEADAAMYRDKPGRDEPHLDGHGR